MRDQVERIWDGDLGSVRVVHHQIELDKMDNRPIQTALYCATSMARERGKQEVSRLLAMNCIQPSNLANRQRSFQG